jgi:hypothetical protein
MTINQNTNLTVNDGCTIKEQERGYKHKKKTDLAIEASQSFYTENDPSMRVTKQGLSLVENSFQLRNKHSKMTYSKLIQE